MHKRIACFVLIHEDFEDDDVAVAYVNVNKEVNEVYPGVGIVKYHNAYVIDKFEVKNLWDRTVGDSYYDYFNFEDIASNVYMYAKDAIEDLYKLIDQEAFN